MNKYQEAMNYLWNAYDENKIYGIASRGHLETLQELVDKAESFEWIPFEMEDGFLYCQIPDDGEDILVSDGNNVWEDAWCEADEGYGLESGTDLKNLAWMPLPEPYKENEDER